MLSWFINLPRKKKKNKINLRLNISSIPILVDVLVWLNSGNYFLICFLLWSNESTERKVAWKLQKFVVLFSLISIADCKWENHFTASSDQGYFWRLYDCIRNWKLKFFVMKLVSNLGPHDCKFQSLSNELRNSCISTGISLISAFLHCICGWIFIGV